MVQDICVFLQWTSAGGLGKSLSQRLNGNKVSRLMMKKYEFHGLRTLADTKFVFQKHFRCADAHCGKPNMARRTCFREQYYTGMRGISVAGKTAGDIRRTLYVKIGWFFHQYLWIFVFVWARAFCGTRYLCFPSVDLSGRSVKISGRSVKILEPKIE